MKNKEKTIQEFTTLTFEISKKLKKQLKNYVTEHDTFMNIVVQIAISEYLSRKK